MGFLRALIGVPLVFVILVFAFVNNDMATFSLWPTDIEITISLSVAIVFFILFGYFVGWISAWASYSPVRSALRKHKKQNIKLVKEQEKLAKEVEGLHDNIEMLKASAPVEEKASFKEHLKNMFYRGNNADQEKHQ